MDLILKVSQVGRFITAIIPEEFFSLESWFISRVVERFIFCWISLFLESGNVILGFVSSINKQSSIEGVLLNVSVMNLGCSII